MDVRRLAAVLVGCGALMAAGGLVGYRASHECTDPTLTQVDDERQIRFAYPLTRKPQSKPSTGSPFP
jgi:hypothetical protein